MSYSFNFRSATKADAKTRLAAEFDRVVQSQPSHAVDRAQAQAAAEAFIGLLPDDEGRDVTVSVSGSVGGTWSGDLVDPISSVNVNVFASLAAKLPIAA